MSAIKTSISYQSQFAAPNPFLNEMRTQSGARLQLELIKPGVIKPVSPKYKVQNIVPLVNVGKHVNLKA